MNLDKEEDLSVVPEEEKQTTSSDTDSNSTMLTKGAKLKSTKRQISDSKKNYGEYPRTKQGAY